METAFVRNLILGSISIAAPSRSDCPLRYLATQESAPSQHLSFCERTQRRVITSAPGSNLTFAAFRIDKAKDIVRSDIEGEMRSFLEAVLNAYEIHGVDELALTKISDFLRVRYGGTNGAKQMLGGIPQIKQAFTEIQTYLYAE